METMLIHIKQIIHEVASWLLCSTKTEKKHPGTFNAQRGFFPIPGSHTVGRNPATVTS